MLDNPIRDIRESKNLSQDVVAAECGLSYSVYYRIEQGSGRTTQDEVNKVLKVLKKMKPGARKIAGRPFGDPKLQAKLQKAREQGESVSAILASVQVPAQKTTSSAPAKKAAPAKATSKTAPAKKSTAKSAPAAKKTTRSRKAEAESLI